MYKAIAMYSAIDVASDDIKTLATNVSDMENFYYYIFLNVFKYN